MHTWHILNNTRGNDALHMTSIVVCIVLILGIYIGYSIPSICLSVLLLRLIKCNKDTAGVFLLLFGGLLGGIIRQLYPVIPSYGLLLMGIGGLCLHQHISSLTKNISSIILMMILFVIFFFSFAYGPISEFAKNKFIYILLFGVMKFFAFFCICRSAAISNKSIGELLLLLSILGISVCLHLYEYQPPNNFLDFEWFRNGYGIYKHSNDEEPLIGYQIIGMNALYALAFFFTSKQNNKLLLLLSSLVCITLTLISGARQSILGIIVLYLAYYTIYKGHSTSAKITNTILGGLIILGILWIFSQLENSAITSLFDTSQGSLYEQSSRELNYVTALLLFEQNPLLGAGLGGYEATGIGPYPHNFILEILCECGVIGLFLILLVLIFKVSTCRINLRYQTRNGTFYFLIILCMFIRASISEDLTESIGIFMSILAIPKHS